MTKHCKYCDTTKPLSDFRKEKTGKFGVRSFCRTCYKHTKEYAQRGGYTGAASLHGMTQAQYDSQLEAQGGKCAICRCKPKSALYIDHCHKTGIRRGLLCQKCNSGLGMFRDEPNLLLAAVQYLSTQVDFRTVSRS